jgi:hypothetical protein
MTGTAAFLLFLAWLAPPGHSQVEREPNDRPADATPLARTRSGQPDFLPTRFADGLVERGQLAPGDVDYYAFAARAGDVVMVSLAEPGRGAFVDPVLAVAGPGDDEPVARDDDGGPGFLPRLAVPIDRTGVWTIAVGGFRDADLDGGDHEERLAYDLSVAVAANPVAVAERDVRGGNDRPGHAELVPVAPERAVVVTGTLEPGDVDHFLLPVPHRVRVGASLYDDEGGVFHDSRLELRDLAGRLIVADDDAGPGFLSNVTLEPAQVKGPVVIRVTGFDPNPADDRAHREQFAYRLVLTARRVTPAWPGLR